MDIVLAPGGKPAVSGLRDPSTTISCYFRYLWYCAHGLGPRTHCALGRPRSNGRPSRLWSSRDSSALPSPSGYPPTVPGQRVLSSPLHAGDRLCGRCRHPLPAIACCLASDALRHLGYARRCAFGRADVSSTACYSLGDRDLGTSTMLGLKIAYAKMDRKFLRIRCVGHKKTPRSRGVFLWPNANRTILF